MISETIPDQDIEHVREACLRGNCSVFAITLHDRTAWPIVGLCERGSRPGDAPIHLLCVEPSGRLVDAAGFRASPGEVIREFNLNGRRPLDIRSFDRDDIERRFRRDTETYDFVSEWIDALIPNLSQLSTKDCDLDSMSDCILGASPC